jgi:Flp pilus assembly CpaF family ATPase
LQETNGHLKDEAHLLHLINRIVSPTGRRVDESSAMVDARSATPRASMSRSGRSLSTGR